MKKLLLAWGIIIIPLSLFSQSSTQLIEQASLYREEGYRLQLAGDLAGALTYYQKAVQLNPGAYEAYNDMGVIYESRGEFNKAIAMYEKAIEVDPDYLAPYANLALIYEGMNDIEKATYYWKKRYLSGQEGDYWWYKSIEHLVKLGTYPEAKKEWLRIKSAPFYKQFSQEREQERLQGIEEAKAHLRIGISLMKSGKYEQAVNELETALSLKPEDNNLQMEISQHYAQAKKMRDKERVRAYVQEAVSYLDKDNYTYAVQKLKDALSTIFSIQN